MRALLRALPNVSARLVALWGGRDAFPSSTPEERRSTLAASHPELDFRVIENAGHWVNWEAANVVNPILLDVLGAAAPART